MCVGVSNADSPFSFADVQNLAKDLAKNAYSAPIVSDLPPQWTDLDYDGEKQIGWKDSHQFWPDPGLPFHLELFHRTRSKPNRVKIFLVEADHVSSFPYSEDYFKFGKLKVPASSTDLGYAGFRVRSAADAQEFLVFLRSSYFRATGAGAEYGSSARGVAVNAGVMEEVEEFPDFTTFWIEKPTPTSRSMTIYALMDGPSITGAYRFLVSHPGATEMEVQSTLFVRKRIDHLGIAPISSMDWLSGTSQNHFGDFRPEVHDSDGALICTSSNGWIWAPLKNNRFNRWNQFADSTGFGLIQRERAFERYEDLEALYQLRPSVWITPSNTWPKGSVVLAQIPTKTEYNDNVVLYWQPANPVKSGDRLDFNYSMTWNDSGPTHPGIATCSRTFLDHSNSSHPARFLISFSGSTLDKFTSENPPAAEIESSGVPVTQYQVVPSPYDHSWRVCFTLPPTDSKRPLELKCHLIDSNSKPISETWSYSWFESEAAGTDE